MSRAMASATMTLPREARPHRPIDPAGYDRTPTLRPAEADALAAAGAALRAWCEPSWPWANSLARLVRPPADAAAIIELPSVHGARSRDDAVALLLSACAEEGRSVWGLDPAVWLRLVGTDQGAFFVAHPVAPDRSVRGYLMALGYPRR